MLDAPKKCAQCDAELPEDSTSSLCAACLLQIGFETQNKEDDAASRATTSYQPAFIPPTAEELAPHFPQLEILEVIGHGGMGVVYKARQKELDRIVALKILRPGISDDASFAERFQREARALAKLNHPNIITVFDFGRRDALFYFVMEFVDGTNLRHLERVGDLNPAEALNIVPQICSALQYAHDNGVVHRDIKPENILIGKDGTVRIADFGLAKLAGTVDNAPLTGTWQVVGTPHYMAPEQFEKPTTVDHRADIYSLGVVIYELLTGELPLGRFPLPSEKVRVDVRLDEVVLRSLDKSPERRYQHVTDVATAVEEAATPSTESRLSQAKEWVKEKAERVAEKTKSMGEKSGGWKTSASRLVNWLAERRAGIGALMMWVGAVDALLSAFTLTEIPGFLRGEEALIAMCATVAGGLTFFYGRQLRRDRISTFMRIAIVFCIIPWFGCFPPSAFFRVILAAYGLLASFGSSKDGNDADDEPTPDIVDRVIGVFKSTWRTISLRLLFFTVFGIAGWCAVCALTFFTLYETWYQHHIPSSTYIHDTTARNITPASDAFVQLDIDASEFQPARGIAMRNRRIDRSQLRLSVPEAPTLFVDLISGRCAPQVNAEDGEESILSRSTISSWLQGAGIDVTSEAAALEVTHLTEALQLMRRTRGLCDRLSMADQEKFPTLKEGILRIRRNDRVMNDNMIPVGWLFNPEILSATGRREPTKSVRVDDWAEGIYFGTLFVIWLIGMLRIVRILYRMLWRPAFTPPDPANTEDAKKTWRWCSLSLVVAGVVSAGLLASLLYSISRIYSGGQHSLWIDDQPLTVGDLNPILDVLGILCIVIAVCGLLARPVLKRFGWWTAAVAGTVAVLGIPLALVTFPTGMATWIALTDVQVKRVFGFLPPEASPDVATAATTVVS